MLALSIIFWTLVAVLAYAYEGFRLMLTILSEVLGRRSLPRSGGPEPSVTIFVPAYNEEKVIRAKIENCLALDYPKDRLEVMVCSDASTDRTAEIVREFPRKSVTFFDYRERSGKTGLINKSVPKARGDIVVLTDANTMLRPDAVRKLVSCYTSEKVGAVLGQVQLRVPEGGRGVEKEISYRTFETDLKFREGLFGAAMGAFGGFYSIRRSLFEPLPPNAYSNDDFLIPMRILNRGYRVLFDKEAVSTEETAPTVEEEFRRRIRIGAGNFQSFFLLPGMLNPFKGARFLFYVSHKVLRWFLPVLLLALLAVNAVLAFGPHALYRFTLSLQLAFYAVAAAGGIAAAARLSLPLGASAYHFCTMNVALLLGLFRYLRGIRSAVWESTSRTAP